MLANEQYPKAKKVSMDVVYVKCMCVCTSSESYLVTSLIARTFGLVFDDAKKKESNKRKIIDERKSITQLFL